MLRLTDVKLPLDHPESAIRAAILAKLGISHADLLSYTSSSAATMPAREARSC